MARMNHLLLYGNYEEAFEYLSNADVGKLIRSALHLLNTGEEVVPTGAGRYIWPHIKDQVIRNMEKYDQVCARNRDNSQKYWDSKKKENMDLLKNYPG